MATNAADRAVGCVVRRIDTPLDLLALHARFPDRYPHLLQSSTPGPQARYDILFAFPEESIILTADGQLQGHAAGAQDFLDALDREWRREAVPHDHADTGAQRLPFRGGWFLYLGYELAAQIEPRLHLPMPKPDTPIARATRVRSAVVRDHATDCLWLLTEAGTQPRLDMLAADIDRLRETVTDTSSALTIVTASEDDPKRYLEWVERTLRYIVDGDVFQANLARTWRMQLDSAVPAAELYRRVRARNPGPFNGLASWAEGAIISSSPERLVRVVNGRIETRPIAGTRPRDADAGADMALSTELLAHPKERAEHIMLIDLERNDLGRVCVPGTVQVDELMVLESYAHVHHIVSNVSGRLRTDVSPGQIIRALFPGGTITGCPKVRCMEIIAELENRPRGAYTGSMGYLNRDGDMDLNILIRTLEQRGSQLELRAGAGIVADSDPVRELAETRAKARGLLLALGLDDVADSSR